jgi:hypothetical protein
MESRELEPRVGGARKERGATGPGGADRRREVKAGIGDYWNCCLMLCCGSGMFPGGVQASSGRVMGGWARWISSIEMSHWSGHAGGMR